MQFGRLCLGSEVYGSQISPRYEKRSYIRAKFLANRDNTIDIYPGQVQFFFQNTTQSKTHHLAYVRWYRPDQRQFSLSLSDENNTCSAEIWQQAFYAMSRDCIIPVQIILSQFVSYNMQFTSRNKEINVLSVIPINKRFHI